MRNNKKCEEKTDKELVDLALKNKDNFACLIKRYENKLLAYILRISNVRAEEAEDILQDVFIKVYKNLRDFDQNLKFSSWIYRVAHNQVISNWRKNKAMPDSLSLEANPNILNQLIAGTDIMRETDLDYLQKNIYAILSRLDTKYKEVLVLKYFEEKNYQEISDILKKPLGTVATLLNRAKQKFKKELTKQNIKL
ncbi:sigma-70 family RNA polymerase sigma factor [Candidatus Parcubacteria bacterium]|nr:sigma-70 family RNA polymerase sigma factor [Candidatus Parcubacteria bacterium]